MTDEPADKRVLEAAMQGCSYFFPGMSRAEAETLLLHDSHVAKDDFLMRSSSQPGHIAVSVCKGPCVRHVLLRYTHGQWALLFHGEPHRYFPFVDELVAFYVGDHGHIRFGSPMTHARTAMVRAARTAEANAAADVAADAAARASAAATHANSSNGSVSAMHANGSGAVSPKGLRLGDEAASRRACPQCSTLLSADSTYCSQCGTHCPVKTAKSDKAVVLAPLPPSVEPVLANAEDILRHMEVCLCSRFKRSCLGGDQVSQTNRGHQ